MFRLAAAIFGFIFLINMQWSCKKDSFLNGPATLSFSVDTVYFDTVFTRVPNSNLPRSRNLQMVVRNTENKSIKTSISLAGGIGSAFRLNIDGQATNKLQDYEIRAKDSIFIFVECILEANNQLNPIIVLDSIVFNTGGKVQDVKLAAYGWDAYYFNDSVLPCNTVWDKTDKPYVIVNSVAVNKNCKLEIKEGVHIYASSNSKMFVLGTLEVNGTKDNKVVFEGDRLQRSFAERPGQWRGIHFIKESKNNIIKHALIKNASIGIQVDSLPINSNPNLIISHTEIKNITNYGIVGLTAKIVAQNCLIYNCGFQAFAAFFGGDYDIRHCTFYGSSNQFNNHLEPIFALNNFQTDDNNNIIRTFDLSYLLVNNIMYGGLENEVSFAVAASKPPTQAIFQNNLIRVKKPENFNPNFNTINLDPFLEDIAAGKFNLTSSSPAIDKGDVNAGVALDFNEKNRDAKPDIGAFEF